MLTILPLLRVWGRKLLAEFPQRKSLDHSDSVFSSTFFRAEGAFSNPDTHSPKMSWWKIVKASAPPCEATPTLSHTQQLDAEKPAEQLLTMSLPLPATANSILHPRPPSPSGRTLISAPGFHPMLARHDDGSTR